MQHVPLKKRIAVMRGYVENEFSSSGLEATIELSQHLDVLIHYMYVFSMGHFRRNVGSLTGRRSVKFSSQEPAGSPA